MNPIEVRYWVSLNFGEFKFDSDNLGWYSLGLIGFVLILGWVLIRFAVGAMRVRFFLGSLPWIGGQYRLRSMADTFDVASTLLKSDLKTSEAFRIAGSTSELMLARRLGLQIGDHPAQPYLN